MGLGKMFVGAVGVVTFANLAADGAGWAMVDAATESVQAVLMGGGAATRTAADEAKQTAPAVGAAASASAGSVAGALPQQPAPEDAP